MPKTLIILARNLDMVSHASWGDDAVVVSGQSLEEIQNKTAELRANGEEFDKIEIIAPGFPSWVPEIKVHYTHEHFLPITDVIKAVNSDSVKYIHVNSDFAGSNFEALRREQSRYSEALKETLNPGQVLVLSNGAYAADAHNVKSSETFTNTPGLSIPDMILASEESLFAVRKTPENKLVCFEHHIFGHEGEKFSNENLREFLGNAFHRAREFESEQELEAQETLAHMTEDELHEYLSTSISLIFTKTLHDGGNRNFNRVQRFHENVAAAAHDGNFDINFRNYIGRTPLISAAATIGKHSIEATKFLMDLGADPNLIDDKGNSALSMAVDTDNTEVAEYLLDHGAQNVGLTRHHESPYQTAIWYNNRKAIDAFARNDQPVPPEMLVTLLSNGKNQRAAEIIKYMVEHAGADPNSPGRYGELLLNRAMQVGDTDLAEFLITKAPIDFEKKGKVLFRGNGNNRDANLTPLELAQQLGNQEYISLIENRIAAKETEIELEKIHLEEEDPAVTDDMERIKKIFFEENETPESTKANYLPFNNTTLRGVPRLPSSSPQPTDSSNFLYGSLLLAGVAITTALRFIFRSGKKDDKER